MTSHLFDDRKGAEKVDGVAALVGVADELSVQLLVTSKGDASSLLVVILKMKKSNFLSSDSLDFDESCPVSDFQKCELCEK